MSTLADEFLHDLEDSGSEGGDESPSHVLDDLAETNGHNVETNENMDDASEADEDDEDAEMGGVERAGMSSMGDPDETISKAEKNKLGGVQSVYSVSTLIKTLRPVLDVSRFLKAPKSSASTKKGVYIRTLED